MAIWHCRAVMKRKLAFCRNNWFHLVATGRGPCRTTLPSGGRATDWYEPSRDALGFPDTDSVSLQVEDNVLALTDTTARSGSQAGTVTTVT